MQELVWGITLNVEPASPTGERLLKFYHAMLSRFGPQNWWPAETPMEMIIGAVLTQNTNWANVEKAIENLRKDDLLDAPSLHHMSPEALAERIRPAGYFNVKARRLKNLIAFLMADYQGDVRLLLEEEAGTLRDGLLGVNGVGPETADSIVLYAAHKPLFVVDAYTFRILSRHDLVEDSCTYEELQEIFMDALPEDTQLFQEFHALIVRTGKEFCRKKPLCGSCPLGVFMRCGEDNREGHLQSRC